jgi:catechol 2,3-dioxygenase
VTAGGWFAPPHGGRDGPSRKPQSGMILLEAESENIYGRLVREFSFGRSAMDVAAPTSTQQPIFSSRRLGHANLWVSDYERAYDYYRNVVGFDHAYIQPDNKASFVSNGNTYHDYGLIDVRSTYAKPGQKPGLNHFAFELRTEAELAAGYRRAKQAGIKFVSMQDHDVAHAVYLLDPDSNEVEVYADVVADWRTARSGVVIKEKPPYVPGESSKAIEEEFYPKNPKILVVEKALFHPKKVAHISLVTKDFEGMVNFYTRVVGLVPYARDSNGKFIILRGSVSQGDLVLHRNAATTQPGLHHVGIEVLDEAGLDRAKAALPGKRITIDSEVDHPARRALTIIGMDGIRTQFFINRDWRAETLASLDDRTALALL